MKWYLIVILISPIKLLGQSHIIKAKKSSSKNSLIEKLPSNILDSLNHGDTIKIYHAFERCFGGLNAEKIILSKSNNDSITGFLFAVIDVKKKKLKDGRNLTTTKDSLIKRSTLNSQMIGSFNQFCDELARVEDRISTVKEHYLVTSSYGTYYKVDANNTWKGFLFLKRDLFYK